MLQLDSRTKSKLTWFATLVAPVLVVQGVRLLVGGSTGPAVAAPIANAAQTPAAAPSAVEPAKPLTVAQTKARAWLLSREKTLSIRSPMDRPDPTPSEVSRPNAISTPDAVAQPVASSGMHAPDLVITGMITWGPEGQSLASINHRIYHLGDAIGTEWRITGIDARNRMVTLTGTDGRTVQLLVRSPATER